MRAFVLSEGPRVRRAVLLGITIGVPLFFIRSLQDPINVPKLALLFAGVVVVATVRLIELLQGAPAEGLRRLLLPALAVALPLTIAWAVSPYRGYSLMGEYGRFQGLTPYLLVALFGVLLADAFQDRPVSIAWAITIAGGAAGAYSILQGLGLDPFAWSLFGKRSFKALSSLGNPNFTGGFLALCLPLNLALWFVDRRFPKTQAWIALFQLAGWAYTYSQGGWLAGVAGVAVTTGFVVAVRSRSRWKTYARPISLVVAGIVALVGIGTAVVGNMFPGLPLIPLTAELRGEWWVIATRMFRASPVFGTGPNTFGLYGVEFRTLKDALAGGMVFPDDPHSVFMSFLAGAGILGGAGFIFLAVWTLRTGIRLADENLLGAGFFGSLTAYLVQSLVSIDELSLRVGLWASLAGLAVSAAAHARVAPASVRRNKKGNKKVPARSGKRSGRGVSRGAAGPLRKSPVVAVLVVAALASMWWPINFVRADVYADRGETLSQRGSYEEGRKWFKKALAFRDEREYRTIYGIALGNGAIEMGAEGQFYFDEMKDQFAFVFDIPDYKGAVVAARVSGIYGQRVPEAMPESIRYFRRAMSIDPINPVIRIQTADLLVGLDRPEEALEVLRPLVDEMPEYRYADFWASLAVARATVGDEAGALEALEVARSIDAGEPRIQQALHVLRENGAVDSSR